MPQYVRSSTRWAIYFRDNRVCTYCGVSLDQILGARDGNFLTLDHVKPKSQDGAHDPKNLVTACFNCNRARGRKSLIEFEKELGVPRQQLTAKVRRRCSKDIGPYREAARLALGELPGFPISQTVLDHDFLVRSQWSSSDFDAQHWEHLRQQEKLFCPECGQAKPTEREEIEMPFLGDEDIPF